MRFAGGLLILLWSASAAAGGFTTAVRMETLRNGLTVLLAPDSLSATVQAGVWYEAGLGAEKSGKSGLTYVVGSLIAADRDARAGALRRRLEAAGGTLGFNIGPDYAGTTEAIPPDALGLALELEAARMGALRVTDGMVREQIDAARREHSRRMAESPLAPAMEKLFATAYAGLPYARPVIGRDEDLEAITRGDVEAYDRARFTPARATLTVVGRFEPVAALEQIRQLFGTVPAGPPASKDRAAPAAEQRAPRSDSLRGAIPVSILVAGWRGPGSADPDDAAFDVLTHLLVGGESGALPRALREPKGPIVQIQGDLDRRRESSLLYVAAVVPSPSAASTAEQRVIEAVEKRAREPVPAADLERAKRQVELNRLFSAQTVLGRTQALVDAQMSSGDWRAWERRIERIRQVSAADIERVAARVLVPERRTIVWLHGVAAAPRGTR
jgi:zinc protease